MLVFNIDLIEITFLLPEEKKKPTNLIKCFSFGAVSSMHRMQISEGLIRHFSMPIGWSLIRGIRFCYLKIILLLGHAVWEVTVSSGGGAHRLMQPAFCSQVLSMPGEFVHQPCILGAFGPHHFTGWCLTARVDFKDSLHRKKRRFFVTGLRGITLQRNICILLTDLDL